MRSMLRLLAVGAIALLISIPAVFAQTPESSTLTVTEPLEVGGKILQPGVYTIRVIADQTTREKIQITSADRSKVFMTVLTVPHQLKPGEDVKNTTFIYYPAAEGLPMALRTWFAPYPHASGGGHDIVYEEARAKQLARLSNASVVAYRGEIADLDTTALSVVTPQATVETYTEPAAPAVTESPAMTSATPVPATPLVTETPAPAPPVTAAPAETPVQTAESSPMDMPRTASNLPLMALLGLASVGAAVAFRLGRPE